MSDVDLSRAGWAIRRADSCSAADDEVDCGATRAPFRACCPSGTVCPSQYNAACFPAGGENYTSAFVDTPRCADPSWVMFDNGGYFCCAAGFVGWNQTRSYSNGCSASGVQLPDGALPLAVVSQESYTTTSTSTSSTSTSTPISTPTPSSISTSSLPTSSSTSTPSPFPTAVPASGSSQAGAAPVGAIVGGVVGGLVGAGLVLVVVWCALRKRRRADGAGPGATAVEVPAVSVAIAPAHAPGGAAGYYAPVKSLAPNPVEMDTTGRAQRPRVRPHELP
ncbi:hypothetical protein GGS23DRAFT_613231 [Durotheca rogersii]|uniref:uncharacterized protein n=1 Tax=Durotheca rogersii TaxID=419775 RepID=UPI00221FB41A|nr:uncharacterized protein GGS23DRAFT_613231 [Durotheca rogersii]KAI5861046.1 hypothetical protein GGS23DRAFT_613231 [Durotheca rogersii]